MYEKRVVVTLHTGLSPGMSRENTIKEIQNALDWVMLEPSKVIAQTDWYEVKEETEESEVNE